MERLQRPWNMDGQLGETVRDRGDYRDHGDQGMHMDNSGRLGETARDWGDYRDHGDQGI